MENKTPIGIFDSGYGGLTIFKEIEILLPGYDYIYLGDNARAPYGNRSFETVLEYTQECVEWMFAHGCPLIILACNTASAKALRSIQQQLLPLRYPDKRVLGVIRPTVEVIGEMSPSSHIGLVATKGTVDSKSYPIELSHFFPELILTQQACPLWVPFIENYLRNEDSLDQVITADLNELFACDPQIDTLLLACTHYPLIYDLIRAHTPQDVKIVTQGPLVAQSLKKYLLRHPALASQISRNNQREFFTTDDVIDFEEHAAFFYGKEIRAHRIHF